MIEDLKKQMYSFFNDIDKKVKDEETLKFLRLRTAELIDCFVEEVERIMKYEENKLKIVAQKQEQVETIMQILEDRVDMICDDIYEPEEESFSVTCPYCNSEFDAEIDEKSDEIICPECSNAIELDWDGNPNDENNNGSCSGNCSGCNNC